MEQYYVSSNVPRTGGHKSLQAKDSTNAEISYNCSCSACDKHVQSLPGISCTLRSHDRKLYWWPSESLGACVLRYYMAASNREWATTIGNAASAIQTDGLQFPHCIFPTWKERQWTKRMQDLQPLGNHNRCLWFPRIVAVQRRTV